MVLQTRVPKSEKGRGIRIKRRRQSGEEKIEAGRRKSRNMGSEKCALLNRCRLCD